MAQLSSSTAARPWSGPKPPCGRGSPRCRRTAWRSSCRRRRIPHTLRTDFALPDGLPIIYPTYIANPGHADRAAAQQALTPGGTALQSVFMAQDHALWFDVNHDGMLGDGDLWMKFAGLTTFDGNGIARGGMGSDYWV